LAHRRWRREPGDECRNFALMVGAGVIVDHHGADIFVPTELLHLGDVAPRRGDRVRDPEMSQSLYVK